MPKTLCSIIVIWSIDSFMRWRLSLIIFFKKGIVLFLSSTLRFFYNIIYSWKLLNQINHAVILIYFFLLNSLLKNEQIEYFHATCFPMSTPSINKQQMSNKITANVDHLSTIAGMQKNNIRDNRSKTMMTPTVTKIVWMWSILLYVSYLYVSHSICW